MLRVRGKREFVNRLFLFSYYNILSVRVILYRKLVVSNSYIYHKYARDRRETGYIRAK
jgi:hypothetical protein